MDQFLVEPTRNTPEIVLKPDGNMRLKGRSIHENVEDFYKESLKWISEYVEVPAETTCVDIQLEYFNSASAKYIIQLLQKLQMVTLKNKKYFINWFYDEGDEDILERGEYFSSVLNVPFNFIEIN
ncbi:MAG TPA: DUF1987 domain-containing protein [Bacteroidales bacterium]|nr:DUF1987 domain-containing protein [Bacteroidales bacterium]